MLEQEILEEFRYRYLNLKTNNYIFCMLDDFGILDNIPDRCRISIAESNVNITYAKNIKIDLAEVNVRDILTYTLQLLKKASLLDINLEYVLEFNDKFDLLKFQSILHYYNIIVQLIFYNVEELELKDQMLFNEIYYFNSIFFNANSFIKNNHFQTYFLSNGRVLDDRENYEKIKIIKRKQFVIEDTSIDKSKNFAKPKDCRTCQNMSCRVEMNEKPIEDCLGYIYHKEPEQVLKKIKR